MPLQSTPMLIDACENGLRIRVIYIGHPQRKLNEVHYAQCVGIAAERYERNGFGWMALSWLISPVLAAIFLALLPKPPSRIPLLDGLRVRLRWP